MAASNREDARRTERDRLVLEAQSLLGLSASSDELSLEPNEALQLRLASDRLMTKRLSLERAARDVQQSRRELRRARQHLEDAVARARHSLERPPRPTAPPRTEMNS